jgi:hypothetical protein
MPPHVPKPGAGDIGPRGVRIADGEYGSPITSQCTSVDKIRIGERHRLDLSDIAGLAESITLQYGCALELLRRALLRDAHGNASMLLGIALDVIAAIEGKRR